MPVGFTRVVLIDVDADGDLDALLGSPIIDSVVLENDGTGRFSWRPDLVSPDAAHGTTRFAAADMDLDGDVDVLVGSERGSERLLTNWSRQVSRRNVLAPGRPAVIELRGPTSGVAALATSMGLANLPHAWGTLRLDPNTVDVLGAYALDANGSAKLLLPIPNDPNLIGVRLYLQGVIGTPLRLSNVEELAITAF